MMKKMPTMKSAPRFALVILLTVAITLTGRSLLVACATVSSWQDEPEAAGQSLNAEQLLEQQSVLARQFEQLEKKLFELYQMERDSRPQRAELLRQMYELAQQRNTNGRFNEIVQLIRTKQLRLAQQTQQDALLDLKSMMELLQKEDESQRLRDEKKRQQENLREIKRLLQKQTNLRSDAIESEDPASLSEQQQALADETKSLQDKIDNQRTGQDSDGENSGEHAPEQREEDKGKDSPESEPSGTEPGSDSSEKSSESPTSEATQNREDSSGQESELDSGDDSLSQRMKAAQRQMQQAEQALQQAEKERAEDRMKEAIEQLEAAKRELESILKQSREEEMMSTLARLEDQFRQMLEAQLRVNQKTLQMEQVPAAVRGPDHEIAAAKLAGEQRKNAMSALRTAMVLRDDSSSVALAVTVEQMNEDMTTISDRLIVADTGPLTQQYENDVVETLEMLIQSVVKAQEDVQQQAQESPSQKSDSSEPGEMPLVDQIAELKMLKGLQERILKRHRAIARELNTDQSPIGEVADSDASSLLEKLEQQQARLFQMTREMVKQIK